MKSLKVGLTGLVILLAIAVGYGYGCGGSDDDKGGSGDTTAAAEADGTSSNAASAESGDGDGAPEDGGNGGGGGDGAPSSKASYIKQGDAICEKVPGRYAQAVTKTEEGNGAEKPSTAEINLKAAVPPLYTAIEEFEGLSPPSGDEQQAEAILDALGAGAKGLEAKPNSPLSGSQSSLAEFEKLSGAYGFKVCSGL